MPYKEEKARFFWSTKKYIVICLFPITSTGSDSLLILHQKLKYIPKTTFFIFEDRAWLKKLFHIELQISENSSVLFEDRLAPKFIV